MKAYKHFVIIRFNIRAHFGCALRDQQNNPMNRILEEDYLEERFALFETYTFPSLVNQTCQNFRMIVLFHKNTPNKYKQRIEKMREKYPFDVLFLGDDEGFSFENFLKDNYSEGYLYYITSRIDNDDMYAKDYIEKIQGYADAQAQMHTCVLTFPRGEKYDLQEGKRYEFEYKQNHFLSMISDGSKNILQYDHSRIEESPYEMVVLETTSVMWTEIVHDSNVANSIQPYVKYQHFILQMEREEEKLALVKTPCIAIYGAGKIGKAVYEKIKTKYKVVCFIDEYTDMKEYDGVRVLRMAELSKIEEEYGVLIAVSFDSDTILENLRKHVGNEVEIIDINSIF